MVHGTQEQLSFLLGTIGAGLLCSLFYDIIRVRRKLINLGNLCVNIEDVFFCIFTGIVFLFVTFYLNSGIIRISGLSGIIIGEIFYFVILRNKVRNLLIFLVKLLVKFISLILNILIFPFKLIRHIFKRPVCIAIWYVGGKFKKIKSKLKLIIDSLKNKAKIISLFTGKRVKKH